MKIKYSQDQIDKSKEISKENMDVKNPSICELHRVEDKIEVIESDLFSNIKGKFSTIYWNHPFITAPEDYKLKNVIEKAIFDPGYQLLNSFINSASKYLVPSGSVLIGLADVGGLDYFRQLAKEHGFSEKEILRETGIEGNRIEITLHELKII